MFSLSKKIGLRAKWLEHNFGDIYYSCNKVKSYMPRSR